MNDANSQCPICERSFPSDQIEIHVNRCIFLNSAAETPEAKTSTRNSNSLKRRAAEDNSRKILKSPRNTEKTSVIKAKQFKAHDTFVDPDVPATTSSKDENGTKYNFNIPLAKQVEPKSLDHFFGQEKILGEDSVLYQLLSKGNIPNMILWGPPGCGKTSLANVVKEICKANPTKLRFQALCAANCGVKDVEKIINDAKMQQMFSKQSVLFMDEVHRFNKRQQDIFLLHVEKGDIILIGATTENPSFSINNALLSRCRVIVMDKLQSDDLMQILERAADTFNVEVYDESYREDEADVMGIESEALKWIADTCDGDARIALSNLQMLLEQRQSLQKTGLIKLQDVKDGIKKSHLLYDRRGEEHYNIISAMHKSIRGSDDNAALYWTTRMIVSGEDPRFIARRLVRAASEDIGNADPNALQLAIATMHGCQLIGMPEADVLLAQCAIYLARAPKSREADSALAAAKRTINECEGIQPAVPMHIRNAPTKLMRELGYGQLENGTTASFMPKGLENVNFFKS